MDEQEEPKLQARLVSGFQDLGKEACLLKENFFETIASVYRKYGFEPLETPALEYADALGKFLPDEERPNQGIFSWKDEAHWVSLRYDLTAPLARYVAMHNQNLPKPFKRYHIGPVWRNEKPGLGRFREFFQADADSVNAPSLLADAEICMLMSDALQALALDKPHVIWISNRKILDGILEKIGLRKSDATYEDKKLSILRTIDKFDKLGWEGVEHLLGQGRMDPSGDFTKGAGLPDESVKTILDILLTDNLDAQTYIKHLHKVLHTTCGGEGVRELEEVLTLCHSCHDPSLFVPNISIVRGLAYYTGTVFEATMSSLSDDHPTTTPPAAGSIASGGRYDSLVARFLGYPIPAVGCSLGVSRLLSVIQNQASRLQKKPIVFILVLDEEGGRESLKLAQQIRQHNIICDVYTGHQGMQAQLKYADKRGMTLALIRGEDERRDHTIIVKDLTQEEIPPDVKDRQAYLSLKRKTQKLIPLDQLLDELSTRGFMS